MYSAPLQFIHVNAHSYTLQPLSLIWLVLLSFTIQIIPWKSNQFLWKQKWNIITGMDMEGCMRGLTRHKCDEGSEVCLISSNIAYAFVKIRYQVHTVEAKKEKLLPWLWHFMTFKPLSTQAYLSVLLHLHTHCNTSHLLTLHFLVHNGGCCNVYQ